VINGVTYRRWLRLAIPFSVASGLAASWIFPPFAGLWSWLDHQTFYTLNGSLAVGKTWQTVIAYANARAFDLVGGTMLVGLMSLYVVRTERVRKRSGWSGIATFLVLVAVGRAIYFDGVMNGVLGYSRPSPTLVLSQSIRLTELLPGIATKDASPWCFPSDHGYFVLCVALFLTGNAGWRLATAGWLVAVLLTLPRLISGAHWLSDILVGSLMFAVLSVGPMTGGAAVPRQTTCMTALHSAPALQAHADRAA
jgi:membrane-associated phospholipid phosphatase